MTTMLTPVDEGTVLELGRRTFRKQLLPIGSIAYNDQRIDFTRDYLSGLVDSFKRGAYDSVPLMFADHANRHSLDPRNVTGEVVGLEMTGDGLDMLVSASDEAARVLGEHPNVGVSARIVPDLHRADGERFGQALQHALITTDPRVTGMRPWEAVEATADATEVLDLSTASYTTEEEPMQQLTEDELTRLRAMLNEHDDTGSEPSGSAETGGADDGATSEVDEDFSDDELAAVLDQLDLDDDSTEAEGGETEPQEVAASTEQSEALELANAQIDELTTSHQAMRAELDTKNWQAERDQLIREKHLPPAVVDLARPLLEGSGHTVELANGQQQDAGAVMRKVLAEIGKQFAALDLSAEVGSAFDQSVEQEAKSRRDATLATWDAQYPVH